MNKDLVEELHYNEIITLPLLIVNVIYTIFIVDSCSTFISEVGLIS